MIVKHFVEPRLAQSSFLVGCPASGHAIVIDPIRRIEPYIEAADAEGLRITAVTETHIHADFASGALALARKTGATLYVSGEGGTDWRYAFAEEPGVRLLRNDDVLRVGAVRLDVVHTPGHTPEHLVFVVSDEARSPEPLGCFTGDCLFVGDVGRPDLLETALGRTGSADRAARQLFASVRAFRGYPDWLLLWPGHGAGSACGRDPGGVPVSSIGYEKLTNWALMARDEEAFVERVLADQPDPPRYFREMKRLNRIGPSRPRARAELRRIAPSDLGALVTRHAEFIDARPDAASIGFLPGSIALPLTRDFITQAGSVLRYGMPVYLVANDLHEALEALDALLLIGIDDVRGWVPEAGLETYARDAGALEQLVNVDPREALRRQQEGHLLLDVRSTPEWRAGHIANAMHAPLARLLDDVRELDRDTPLIVYCQAGARSRVAATALRRVGFTRVANLSGGYEACVSEASCPTPGAVAAASGGSATEERS